MPYDSICYADIETTAIPVTGILDIETIHCIAVKSEGHDTLCYTSRFLPLSNYGGTLQNALDFINTHKVVVFHNYTFDIPVIENLLGHVTATVLDTMILAKLIYTKDELTDSDVYNPEFPKSLYGRFSLEAFGHRIGLHKGDFKDWTKLSVEMCEYCTNDVDVTHELFHNLLDAPNFPAQNVIDLEHEVAYLVAQQTHYGFYYDIARAKGLQQKLRYEKVSLELKLAKTFRPKFLPDDKPIIPAGARRNKQYHPNPDFIIWNATDYFPRQYKIQKNGKTKVLAASNYKWFDSPHRLVYSYTEGEYQKIKLTKFDPGSRTKIRYWLKSDYDFEFATYTDKGNAKVNGDELHFLAEGADLMRYLKVVKDLSEVASGLEHVREHSNSIHGRVDTIGAATHRATHSSPNVAQVSATKDFRQLWTAPPGMVLIGADLANIEVRVLAHYLYPYDEGKYAEAVLSKDMHWYHAKLAGFWSEDDRDWPSDEEDHLRTPEMKAARTKSKTFFFGYLYGQGDTIRGHILWTPDCLPDYTQEEYDAAKERVEKRIVEINGKMLFPLKKDEYVAYDELLIKKTIYGKRVADIFLEKLVGIKELIADCAKQSRETGYVQAIDGRLLYSRSPHSALNLLLQGSAGVIAKQWMANYHRLAHQNGLDLGYHYWQSAYVHDEYQCPCLPDYASTLSKCLVDGAAKVTTDLNMNIPVKADAVIGQNWSETH